MIASQLVYVAMTLIRVNEVTYQNERAPSISALRKVQPFGDDLTCLTPFINVRDGMFDSLWSSRAFLLDGIYVERASQAASF